jgi:2'-5' RNA ligase
MRLFVAVELPPKIREAAREAASMLEQRLDRGCRIRWVPADQMHLTVRFIGRVPDDEVPVVLDALAPPLPLEAFEVEFGGCGVFPRSGPPRVIWIGVSQGVERLQAMHQEFNRRLSSLFVPREDRPFSAHLTLARIKEIGSKAGRQLRESVRDVQPHSVRCRVDAATVFRSELSPRGARYSRLLQVLLTPQR